MSIVEPSRAIEVAPIGDTSVLAFFRDMNVPERGTFWACAPGRALGNAIAIFAVLAYGVFFIAAFPRPERRGRILHADA